jgi:uncharacterized UPF0160 family protein
MLEWNPLPINLEATIIKLSIDLCLFFRHFHEQIILKINNKALTESYEGFFNTLITGFQIYTSSKAQIETIKNMIENFNRAPEIQSEQQKNFALIAAIIHDLNTTFSNIAFILCHQAFDFRPNHNLANEALIIELDQANNNLIPQLDILDIQRANFVKYFFELHYLHQELLSK